jgi:hypothetical protein
MMVTDAAIPLYGLAQRGYAGFRNVEIPNEAGKNVWAAKRR